MDKRIVIMAAGKGDRWNNYLGMPKQLVPVNDEPLIKRTIRQLIERGVTDIYVTVRKQGQYGDLGVKEHVTDPNEMSIDRIWGAKELVPCIFLYGDVYYTDKAMTTIINDEDDFRFFGRLFPNRMKADREIYAIKANSWVIERAGEVREMHCKGTLNESLGQYLYCHCIGLKPDPLAKNYIERSNKLQSVLLVEINDDTTDFDTPADYHRFTQLIQQAKPNRNRLHPQAQSPAIRRLPPIQQRTRTVARVPVSTAPVKAYFTLTRLNYDLLHTFLPKIPADIDLVIGIPRDGMLIAYLISIYRNIPMVDLTSFCLGLTSYKPGLKHREGEKEVHNALLVDDICASGTAMRDALRQIKDHIDGINLFKAAVYVSKPQDKVFEGVIDYWGCELTSTRSYEWTHGDAVYLPGTMMDIDGILCPDWAGGDDSGEAYVKWLSETPLKLRPKNIGTLITWRREEHRQLTEAWLKRVNINYGNLIMADRSKWAGPSEYKARHYQESEARLLIESSEKQAKRIFELTGRPVVCFETNEAFGVMQ